MPGNKIRVPDGLPVTFYRVDPPPTPQYNRIHLGQDWFVNTIRDYESKVEYFQKWQQTDTISLQVQSNYDPIKLEVRDCAGRTIQTLDFELKNTAVILQGFRTYEVALQLAEIPEGVYYLLLIGGFGDTTQTMISEPLDLRLKHPDTVLVEYSNSFNKGGIIWDTAIKMQFRVEGDIVDYEPGSEDVIYIDQPRNAVQLSSTPYDSFTLSIGGSTGIPNWVAKKLNSIFSFDHTFYDGVQYVKAQGARMERNEVENYPLYGWRLPILPAKNISFTEFDDTFDDEVVITSNIQTDLFGIFPPGDGSITISEKI